MSELVQDVSGAYPFSMAQELQELQNKSQNFEAYLKRLEATATAKDKELEEEKLKKAEIARLNEDLQKKYERVVAENGHQKEELVRLQKIIEFELEKNEELEKCSIKKDHELQEKTANVLELEEKQKALGLGIVELEDKVLVQQDMIAYRDNQIAELKKAVGEMQTKISDSEKKLETCKNNLYQFAISSEELQLKSANLTQGLELKNKEIENLKQENLDIEKRLKEGGKVLHEKDEQMFALQCHLRQVQENFANEISSLKEKELALSNQLLALQKCLQEKERLLLSNASSMLNMEAQKKHMREMIENESLRTHFSQNEKTDIYLKSKGYDSTDLQTLIDRIMAADLDRESCKAIINEQDTMISLMKADLDFFAKKTVELEEKLANYELNSNNGISSSSCSCHPHESEHCKHHFGLKE